MPKFRVMASREEWITVTVEADSAACAARQVNDMDLEELHRLDEQNDGDFHILDVEPLDPPLPHTPTEKSNGDL